MKYVSKATIDKILKGDAPSSLDLGITVLPDTMRQFLAGSASQFPTHDLGVSTAQLQAILDALGQQGIRGFLLGLYLAPERKVTATPTQQVSVKRADG